MDRTAAVTARMQSALSPVDGEGQGNGKLPPELRFLAAQATDPEERKRIVRAYYTFAHGTPESASVQFALLAGALLRANLAAAQDVAEHAAKVTTASASATTAVAGARPAASPEEITAAVRQALQGMAEGLNVLSDQVASQSGQRWTGAALLLTGILIGYALARF
jgi:hypothetical protein